MLALLGTHFLNPLKSDGTRTLGLISTDTNEPATCNLSKLAIEAQAASEEDKKSLLQTAWEAMHRFVRLWRKLGWAICDLDKAITALKPTDWTIFLKQLSHIQRLRAGQAIPIPVVLSWWSIIDTTSYADYTVEELPEIKSLYEQLFRNRSVINPVDEIFTLNSGQNELANPYNPATNPPDPTKRISAHSPAVVAVLGISTAELALLLGTPPVATGDSLNLANLSRLYRITSFARFLQLSLDDFLVACALTAINPFSSTEATLRFVERVGMLRASGFSINELDYLLRHTNGASTTNAPSEESIAHVLTELRQGLQKIAADNTFVPDPTGELTRQKLALLLKSDDMAKAMALLDGQSSAVRRHFN